MTMIEKVARAICAANGDDWGREGRSGLMPAYEPLARAALEAMREATDHMCEEALDEAGWRAEPYTAPRESGVPTGQDMTQDEADYINNQGKAAMADTFCAMIDAALTEPSSSTPAPSRSE